MFLSTGTSLEEEEKEVPSGFPWEIPTLMSLHLEDLFQMGFYSSGIFSWKY